MAVDFQRFTHFRPCIDLHDGKVKQVCLKEKSLDLISALPLTFSYSFSARSLVAHCQITRGVFEQTLLPGKERFALRGR